jgi:hypothetical protein
VESGQCEFFLSFSICFVLEVKCFFWVNGTDIKPILCLLHMKYKDFIFLRIYVYQKF